MFEQQFRNNSGTISIFEKIGRPTVKPIVELREEDVNRELKKVLQLLQEGGIQLEVQGKYPPKQLYRFVTEELFQVQVEKIEMPGFVYHFCFEDFYPNHDLEIRYRLIEFLSIWFSKQLSEYNYPFISGLRDDTGNSITKEEVLRKTKHIYNAYLHFSNCEYKITRLAFEFNKEQRSGSGTVEGKVRYDAVLESGEAIHTEGIFRNHFVNNGRGWNIVYFSLPGMEW